ncbi:hypothetical protein AB1N83_010497 [Pleurotus pulmonarius]
MEARQGHGHGHGYGVAVPGVGVGSAMGIGGTASGMGVGGAGTLEYELTVRQEPKQARMCGIGGKADRRPIDPPPIVQLRVIDPSHRRRNLQAPPPPHGLHSYPSQSSQSTQLQQHSSPAQNSNIPPHQRRKAIHIASPSHASTSSAVYGPGGRGGLRSDDEHEEEDDEEEEGDGDVHPDARRSTSKRGGARSSRGRGAEVDDDTDMSGR